MSTQLRRAAGVDHNPLCRATDRARSRLWLARAFALVLVTLLGWGIGVTAYQAGLRDLAAEAGHHHRITATVLTKAITADRSAGRGVSAAGAWAAAEWTDSEGRSHTEQVPVAPETAAGARVPVWVDDEGDLAAAPPPTADVLAGAALLAIGVLLAGTALVMVGGMAACRVLDRRDDEAWTRGWAQVEPAWSGRGRQGADGR